MEVVVVLDFDGTVTQKDIGDEVCDRFAPPIWRDIDAAWVRREISLPEAQRRMWALARCQRQEAVDYARQIGHLRAGLDRFLDAVLLCGGRLWLASGGFDFYVEAILAKRLQKFERAFFNRTRFADGKIEVEFPHSGLACSFCAVCKGLVCDQARQTYPEREIIFVGDGASDRCAVGRADRLFAVRGSLLEKSCREVDAPYVAFDGLDELIES